MLLLSNDYFAICKSFLKTKMHLLMFSTMTKVDDFHARVTPTIIPIFADPKYNLKPMKEFDWKKHSQNGQPKGAKNSPTVPPVNINAE